MDIAGAGVQFPSTHWSSVMAAGENGTEEGQRALAKLLERYGRPLRFYLCYKFGCGEDQAEDILQSFILEIVLQRDLIRQARPMKGHQFRSFLLSALRNFATSQYRRERAKKRCPEAGLASLEDVGDQSGEAAVSFSPEMFDVAWARQVIAEAVARMQQACEASERPDIWRMFEGRLMRPIVEGAEATPYEELVNELGLQSPAQAQNLLVTAKRMFARSLRAVIAEYAPDAASIETELRELQIILSHAKG